MRRRMHHDGTCERFITRPHAALRPGVHSYRGFRLDGRQPHQRLVIPRGTVSVLLGFGPDVRVRDVRPAQRSEVGCTSLLGGLHTRARLVGHHGRLHGVEITLAPWAAHRLFGTPAGELAETVVHPGDLLGPRVHHLTEALQAAPDWPARFALLDSALMRWADESGSSRTTPAPVVMDAWDVLRRTCGRITIRELAARTGWSVRHLESRFRGQIGLTPKRLARILRLRRALQLLTTGNRPAQVAFDCGFYDQAHLTREFTSMVGTSPGRFLAAGAAGGGGEPASAWLAG